MPSNSVAVGESPAAFQPAISAWNQMSQGLSDLVQKYYNRETLDKSPLSLMKEMLGWSDLVNRYREMDRANDPNAKIQDALRDQTYADLTNPGKDITNQFLSHGLITALNTGNTVNPIAYAGNATGKAILQNIFGQDFEKYRQMQKENASKFLEANPVQENVPTTSDVINYNLGREQDKINARNEKMDTMLGMGQKNVADTGNMIQNMMGAIQQYGANVANAHNTSNAGSKSILSGLLSTGGTLGGAAITAF